MNKNKIITVSVIMLILAVAGAIIYFKNYTGATIQDTDSEKVAKWIGGHSTLYVQTGCPACKTQEDLFGANIKYLTIIDCLIDKQAGIDAGIEKTPTWVINGQKYVGVQSIEKLKELTGYQD